MNIPRDHLMPRVKQGRNDMAAHEAARARDQDFQRSCSLPAYCQFARAKSEAEAACFLINSVASGVSRAMIASMIGIWLAGICDRSEFCLLRRAITCRTRLLT